jgi:hypothetical protein
MLPNFSLQMKVQRQDKKAKMYHRPMLVVLPKLMWRNAGYQKSTTSIRKTVSQ